MENIKLKIEEMIAVVFMTIMLYIDDVIDLLKTIIVSVLLCFLLTRFIIMPVRVNGTSMHPTIYNNSIGFSSIISKNIGEIERFDIVIAYLEEKDERLVKRVIGLPGDTIEYIDGQLYINNQLTEEYFLDQNYVNQQLNYGNRNKFTNDFSVTLGDDEYFLLGDNRLVSADSRSYGSFSKDDILAKGIFIVYPFDKFGFGK